VSFLIRLCQLLKPFWCPFVIIFQKKNVPKMASKKGASCIKTTAYGPLWTCPEAPREAASLKGNLEVSQTRNNNSSTNFKHCCSISFFFSKCCLNSFKSTLLMIWHALGTGPANLFLVPGAHSAHRAIQLIIVLSCFYLWCSFVVSYVCFLRTIVAIGLSCWFSIFILVILFCPSGLSDNCDSVLKGLFFCGL